nr:uncharacterized protein LOC115259729 [Aedes albopictus]
MSVHSELEEISRRVAEHVVGDGDSEPSGSAELSLKTDIRNESDVEDEDFKSPSVIRKSSFEDLSKKDPRYKEKFCAKSHSETMAEETLQQLMAALNALSARNVERRFDIRDWIDSIEKAAVLYKGDDDWKLQCGIVNLQGAAKLWFSGATVKTWQEFKALLVRDFPTAVDVVSIHQMMMCRKKLQNESLETYFYSHVAMGKKGKLPDQAIIKYIVLGLDGRFGTIAQVDNLPDLLKQLKWLAELKEMKISDDNVRKTVVKPLKTTGSSSVKCFRCGSMGHVAATCNVKNSGKFQNVECFRCNKRGHIAKNCGQDSPKDKVRVMQEVSQQCNYVKAVTIGNFELDALYDCGSAVTTIKQCCKNALSNIEQCDLVLVGFGGNEVRVTEKSAEKLTIDGLCMDASVCVVPNKVQANSVIIGRDILDRDDIRFVKERGSARIEKIPLEVSDQAGATAIGKQSDVLNIRAFEPVAAEEINVDGNEEVRRRIWELVLRYRHCFAKNYEEMGTVKDYEMIIEMSDPQKPVHTKQYAMEYAREKVIENTVEELLGASIIQPSKSPYNSPALLVRKKNGDWRMVVDYRAVNEKIVKEKWPMPVIEDCLNRLVGGKLFVAVDLFRGYHQIPIAENSRKFTAFSTPHGHFEFLKMPFGLSNGSAVFQRMIDMVIAPLKSMGFVAYLDDVTFGGKDIEEVMQKLEIFSKNLVNTG